MVGAILKAMWVRFAEALGEILKSMFEQEWGYVAWKLLPPCMYTTGIVCATAASLHFSDPWWSIPIVFVFAGILIGFAVDAFIIALLIPIFAVVRWVRNSYWDAWNKMNERE